MPRKHAVALLEGDFSDPQKIKHLLLTSAWNCGLRVVGSLDHFFHPQGYTAIILLAESHLSIHTFPENNEASIDCFTCGEHNPELVIEEAARLLSVRIKRRKSLDREKC